MAAAGAALASAWILAGSAHADPAALTSADREACGAFSMTSALVHESTVSDPGPGGAPSRTYDLVGLANALNEVANPLNTVNGRDLSRDLGDDLHAYVYALAEVGAAINHHESTDYGNLYKTRDTVADRCELWDMSRSDRPR
jgi:hypothetical protein